MISYSLREGIMNKSNIRFLSSFLAMSVFCMTGAFAAPSVKMLGTNASHLGTNTTVVRSDNTNTSSTQRLGSVRAKTIATGAPVTVNKVATKVNTGTSSEESRLSLGNYIHSTGVSAGTIKPASATSSAVVSSDEFESLVGRVETLEQDKLEFGSGFKINNNVVSVDVDQVEETVNDILEEHGDILEPEYPSVTNQDNIYDSINVADEFDENFNFKG